MADLQTILQAFVLVPQNTIDMELCLRITNNEPMLAGYCGQALEFVTALWFAETACASTRPQLNGTDHNECVALPAASQDFNSLHDTFSSTDTPSERRIL